MEPAARRILSALGCASVGIAALLAWSLFRIEASGPESIAPAFDQEPERPSSTAEVVAVVREPLVETGPIAENARRNADGPVATAARSAATLRVLVVDARTARPISMCPIVEVAPSDPRNRDPIRATIDRLGVSGVDGSVSVVLPSRGRGIGELRWIGVGPPWYGEPRAIPYLEGDLGSLTLVANRGAVVTGRVRDDEGKPVAFATISLRERGRGIEDVLEGRVREGANELGEYRLVGIPSFEGVRYALVASAEAHETSDERTLELDWAGRLEVDFVLRRTGVVVRGRLVGNPGSDGAVSICRKRSSSDPFATCRVGFDGRFVFRNVPRDEWTLVVDGACLGGRDTLDLRTGPDSVDVGDLAAMRVDTPVEVEFTDASGAPVDYPLRIRFRGRDRTVLPRGRVTLSICRGDRFAMWIRGSPTGLSGDEFTMTAEDLEWVETSLARVKVEAKGVVVVLPPEVDELGSDEPWSVYVQCGIIGLGSPITDRAKRIVIPETGPDRATISILRRGRVIVTREIAAHEARRSTVRVDFAIDELR